MDFYQLRQLVAIDEYGTVSAAAEQLHMSQPSLSRSMQRLETELGVPLFDRRRNRLQFNEVGRLAVKRSRDILRETEDLSLELQTLFRSLSTLSIGSCSFAPMWLLGSELQELYPEKAVTYSIGSDGKLVQGLLSGRFQYVLLSRPPEQERIVCREHVTEQLYICLPTSHPLSSQAGVRFSDLAGQTILTYVDLGVWQPIIDAQKELRLIRQHDWKDLAELVRASGLPTFISSLSHSVFFSEFPCVTLPILDDGLTVSLYLCCLEDRSRDLEALSGSGRELTAAESEKEWVNLPVVR